NNGWTGGQYSLFRGVLGWSLLMSVGPSLSAADSAPGILLAVAGLGLAALLLIGWGDRAAALALALLLALPAFSGSGGPFDTPPRLALMIALLLHSPLPPAPYGSLAARGRADPGGGWRLPPWVHAAAWIALSALYGYLGYAAVQGIRAGNLTLGIDLPSLALVAELTFLPLALLRPARPPLWIVMLAVQLALVMTQSPAGPGWGILVLHLLAFDPAWVPPAPAPAKETLFYDGGCGLCHRFVRFLLAEDRDGAAFGFAPLESAAFRTAVPEPERGALPDSLVLRTADGALLTRSAAVRHIAQRLGGVWRVLAVLAGVVPAGIRDAGYDLVARIRKRLFAPPAAACPIVTPELRGRFEE
ncbi:MAG: thiol-disulfide oxidoreductase DCC family protein, partial [Gemmatimonadales bacterium]